MTETITTSYLGFTILVSGLGFTVLGRNGEAVVTVTTMQAARRVISSLRREERAK